MADVKYERTLIPGSFSLIIKNHANDESKKIANIVSTAGQFLKFDNPKIIPERIASRIFDQ